MTPDSRKPADGDRGADGAMVRAAAEWRARQDAGLTPAEQGEFLCWLEQDVRHAELFGEMEDTWSLLDRTRELPLASLVAATAPSADSSSVSAPAHRPRRFWLPASLAAAASLAVAVWAWQRPGDQEIQFAESTTAEAGMLKRVNLPDGSVVRLRPSSAIAVSLSKHERHVRLLRGEAHFTVAKDSARPFVVEANGVGVRAVGTAFSVTTAAGSVEVLVTEGKVGVESALPGAHRATLLPKAAAGDAPVLSAGEKALVTLPKPSALIATATVERLAAKEIESALAWQRRTLAFEAAPLAEIVGEYNRYNRQQFVVADAGLAGLRFGGSFRADDPDGFVALLAATAQVAVETRGNETVLRSRR